MRIQSLCRRDMEPWTGGSSAIHPDTTEICIMVAGEQYLRIDGETFVMKGGDVCIIAPGTEHLSWTEGDGYSELVIHTSPLGVTPGLRRADPEALAAVVARPDSRTVARLLELLGEPVPAVADPQVHRVISTVQADLDGDWDVNRMARVAHWSPAHFSRRFSEIVGSPPMRWLREQRVARAAWLLRATEHSVSSIALQVGFSSTSRLSEAFTSTHGVSPSRFREDDGG